MPNLIHLAEYLGGGLGCILLGWVLRWGQHRDDCRELQGDEFDRGWDHGSRWGWETGYELGRDDERDRALVESEPEPLEEYTATHTIYPELAALAAEDVPRPELLTDTQQPPGHLESTQEWQARMDLEAAQWCARHGLRHESAWAA